MIDEKVLIERLEEYKYSHLVEHDKERLEHCTENENTEHCEGIDCFWCVWDKSISIVNQLAEEHNNGWIPCSEKLPEDAGDYLVTQYNPKSIDEYCNGYRVESIFFDDNGWWDDMDCYCGWTIIAWQPLPAPYKGKQK